MLLDEQVNSHTCPSSGLPFVLCSGGGGGQFNLDRLDGDEKENQEDAREWSLTRNDQDLRIERSSVYLSVRPTSGSERVIMTKHFDATQKCISLIDIALELDLADLLHSYNANIFF